MFRKLMIVVGCVAVVVAVSSLPSRGERQPIDRIIAVIEDEAIFASDVTDIIRQILFQSRTEPPSEAEMEELRREALENLINDKLVMAEARRRNIEIPFQDIEARVNDAIEENKQLLGGEEAFNKQLEREGFSEQALRELYREQIGNRMLVERVLQAEMARDRRQPDDEELYAYFLTKQDELPERPAVVHLQTVFIGFDAAASASGNARRDIDAIYERLERGEDFATVARDASQDPSASRGGDLGFLAPADLADENMRKAAESLGVGEFSEPIRTPYGWHILRVSEKNPDDGTVRLAHVLIRVNPSDGDIAEVFAQANLVHKQLVAGADFDSMAVAYPDPGAGPDGDLGWLKTDDLPDFFQSILEGMRPGDVSQVLREQAGFRIVKLLERDTARPYEFSEVKDELLRMWQQDQGGTVYAEYVEELRKKFNVEMKVDAF